MQRTRGRLDATGLRFAIVVARFNEAVTARLLDGAIDALTRHGAAPADVEVVEVPGAFEVPLAAQTLGEQGRFDAIVCLGAVIRGETPHFDYIAAETAAGIGRAMARTRVPMAFGVLTTDTADQALARAGGEVGNKGYEAATTAIEMATLLRMLGPRRG